MSKLVELFRHVDRVCLIGLCNYIINIRHDLAAAIGWTKIIRCILPFSVT